MPWYVIYTKPRNEKKVANALEQLGVKVFCPVQLVEKQWSDRKKKVSVPLFNSYVFVFLEADKRDIVFQVAGVVRYLFWLGKPAVVRDQEIETLQQWVSGSYQSLTVAPLLAGTRTVVAGGVFKGQTAIVQEHRGKKLRLLMESLGIMVTMQV